MFSVSKKLSKTGLFRGYDICVYYHRIKGMISAAKSSLRAKKIQKKALVIFNRKRYFVYELVGAT